MCTRMSILSSQIFIVHWAVLFFNAPSLGIHIPLFTDYGSFDYVQLRVIRIADCQNKAPSAAQFQSFIIQARADVQLYLQRTEYYKRHL
jgi:hypothetical protein